MFTKILGSVKPSPFFAPYLHIRLLDDASSAENIARLLADVANAGNSTDLTRLDAATLDNIRVGCQVFADEFRRLARARKNKPARLVALFARACYFNAATGLDDAGVAYQKALDACAMVNDINDDDVKAACTQSINYYESQIARIIDTQPAAQEDAREVVDNTTSAEQIQAINDAIKCIGNILDLLQEDKKHYDAGEFGEVDAQGTADYIGDNISSAVEYTLDTLHYYKLFDVEDSIRALYLNSPSFYDYGPAIEYTRQYIDALNKYAPNNQPEPTTEPTTTEPTTTEPTTTTTEHETTETEPTPALVDNQGRRLEYANLVIVKDYLNRFAAIEYTEKRAGYKLQRLEADFSAALRSEGVVYCEKIKTTKTEIVYRQTEGTWESYNKYGANPVTAKPRARKIVEELNDTLDGYNGRDFMRLAPVTSEPTTTESTTTESTTTEPTTTEPTTGAESEPTTEPEPEPTTEPGTIEEEEDDDTEPTPEIVEEIDDDETSGEETRDEKALESVAAPTVKALAAGRIVWRHLTTTTSAAPRSWNSLRPYSINNQIIVASSEDAGGVLYITQEEADVKEDGRSIIDWGAYTSAGAEIWQPKGWRIIPIKNDDGTPALDDDGKPLTTRRPKKYGKIAVFNAARYPWLNDKLAAKLATIERRAKEEQQERDEKRAALLGDEPVLWVTNLAALVRRYFDQTKLTPERRELGEEISRYVIGARLGISGMSHAHKDEAADAARILKIATQGDKKHGTVGHALQKILKHVNKCASAILYNQTPAVVPTATPSPIPPAPVEAPSSSRVPV